MEALMRRALNILLVVAGVLVSVIGSQSETGLTNDRVHNVVVVDGLHIALPNGLRSFPAGLIPLP